MLSKIKSFLFSLLLLPIFGHTQTWKWAQALGSANSNTTVKSIRPYTGTSVLVSGSFAASTLTLGGHTLNSAGQDDGFVAIADENGQYNWAVKFGGSGRDFLVDAAANPTGGFVVAGNFSSISMNIGGINLFNSGETDAFVVKYNADKTLAWAKKIGTADIDEVTSVAVDAEGNIYILGNVLDKFTNATLHVFLRKWDAAGSQAWERKGSSQGGILQAPALALGSDQSVYIGGMVWGTATFGGTNLSSSDTSNAAFIIKYNPSGTILDTWLDNTLDKINGLQVHGTNVYACAEKMNWGIGWGWPLSDSKIHVLKMDTGLNLTWHKKSGGDDAWQSLDIAKSISVDDGGNVYVTGYFFSDTLHFAGQKLTNPFNVNYFYPQIFVFKYSPGGNEIWGKSLGGIHSDEATCIHAIGDDQFYLGGHFESNPVAFGAFSLQNTGTLDSIYVHLRPARYGRKTMGFLAVFDKNVSSTKPEQALGEVAIFPNPASDHITVRLKNPTTSPLIFQLTAADGRLLRQATYLENVSELREDLTGVPPGLYFIALRTDEGVFVGKLVKR